MNYLENAHAAAETWAANEAGFQIANRPALYFSQGTHHLNGVLRVPLEETVEFLTDHGLGADDLRSLAVEIFPRIGEESRLAGQMASGPREYDGRIHYPIVRLGVFLDQKPDDDLNSIYRHELRHVLQNNDSTPLHRRPIAKNLAKGAGIVAAAGLVKLGFAAPDLVEKTVYFDAAALSSLCALKSQICLYNLSPREIDANIFAWRTRDFRPISLAE